MTYKSYFKLFELKHMFALLPVSVINKQRKFGALTYINLITFTPAE